MSPKPLNYEEYLRAIDPQWTGTFVRLHDVINSNLPRGFEEAFHYGMPGWVVPHSLYPAGYHATPSIPLPFAGLAAQKHYISFYHMGLYADPKWLERFTADYAAAVGKKPDMGKSCLRFRKTTPVPFDLLASLLQEMTPQEWIDLYERSMRK